MSVPEAVSAAPGTPALAPETAPETGSTKAPGTGGASEATGSGATPEARKAAAEESTTRHLCHILSSTDDCHLYINFLDTTDWRHAPQDPGA
jgi:hypothetical protein